MKARFDIFVCAGGEQLADLERLLPMLEPHGTVHLASSYLEPEQVRALEPWFDVLHEPRHDPDGYENFRLFCIRDLNRVAKAPHFIKLDTDVVLADNWIEYVNRCLKRSPDAVLFGPHSGSNKIDYDISGELVERRLGGSLRVRDRTKVNGSFYVGNTSFFREHDATMQQLHDLIYAFKDGQRFRPRHLGEDPDEAPGAGGLVHMRGVCALRAGKASEDNLRSLTVHFVGGGKQLLVRPPRGRVLVPDKMDRPSLRKRVKKTWKKRRRSIRGESWRSSKKPEGYE